MKHERDYQRSKVYRWEAQFGFCYEEPEYLTLDECEKLVGRVYKRYEIQPPIVKDGRGRGRGRGRARACGSLQEIRLPHWTRYLLAILHECAHGLTQHVLVVKLHTTEKSTWLSFLRCLNGIFMQV